MNTPDLDVKKVADLARLALTESEIVEFQGQLGRVLEHVEQLSRLNLDGVEPTAHANPVFDVFREDSPTQSLTKQAALANAPQQANGLFIVTKVLE